MSEAARSIGIVGSGTMGTGIAMAFADAGFAVRILDASPEALARARATIATTYAGRVQRGKLAPADADARAARIAGTNDVRDLAAVDVAIEAVFEDLAVKRDVFASLGAVCRPDALLATNTSTLDVDAVFAETPRPERCLGLHFFSPAHVMKLVEVVRGAASAPATIDAARDLCARIGKLPIVVGNCDGFVGNRMLLGFRREAEFAVLAGATFERVDGLLEEFGFAMGPFAVSDLAGIDVGWRAKRERIKRGAAPPFALTELTDALVAAGRLGQKTNAGFYRYEPGDRTRHADPAVEAVVATERSRLGIARRSIDDAEIVRRCLYALAMEGGRILDEGIAASPDDIDAIWVNGYGFPRARGGPMAFARDTGLDHVRASIAEFAARDPAFWRPSRFLGKQSAH